MARTERHLNLAGVFTAGCPTRTGAGPTGPMPNAGRESPAFSRAGSSQNLPGAPEMAVRVKFVHILQSARRPEGTSTVRRVPDV